MFLNHQAHLKYIGLRFFPRNGLMRESFVYFLSSICVYYVSVILFYEMSFKKYKPVYLKTHSL